jgi:hypothetical protein
VSRAPVCAGHVVVVIFIRNRSCFLLSFLQQSEQAVSELRYFRSETGQGEIETPALRRPAHAIPQARMSA